MKVSDIMTAPAVTVREDSTLEQVARVMLDHRIGGVPVVGEDGRLRGMVHEDGQRRHREQEAQAMAQGVGDFFAQRLFSGHRRIVDEADAIPVTRGHANDQPGRPSARGVPYQRP